MRQERIIKNLCSYNSQYEQNLIFVSGNWKDYSDAEMAIVRNILRRSTLLLLRGDNETGCIVAGTSKEKIKRLLGKRL